MYSNVWVSLKEDNFSVRKKLHLLCGSFAHKMPNLIWRSLIV
jgi:hypothetical protein